MSRFAVKQRGLRRRTVVHFWRANDEALCGARGVRPVTGGELRRVRFSQCPQCAVLVSRF